MDDNSKKAKPSAELVDLTGEEGRKAHVDQPSAEISELARTTIPANASGMSMSKTSKKTRKQTKKATMMESSSEDESSEDDADSDEDSASLFSSEGESDTSESDVANDDSDVEVEYKKHTRGRAATVSGLNSDSKSRTLSYSDSETESAKTKARPSFARGNSTSDSEEESRKSKSKSSKSQARSNSGKSKHKSETSSKEVTGRAWNGTRAVIFVGTEVRPVVGVRFFDPFTGLISTLTNSRGATFIKGAFYFAKSDGARLLASRRVEQPDDLSISDVSDKYFEVCKKKGQEKTGLVLLGCVVSFEAKQIVKTRRNEEVPMREFMMQFRTKDGCFKSSPITVWGRLAKDRPEVGAFYVLLNAKQADYLGMPRFSVGDNGALAKLDLNTPQTRDLKRFFATDDDDGELELPEGVSEWKETNKPKVAMDDDE
jgi:RNase P/RNase MRP subunit p29